MAYFQRRDRFSHWVFVPLWLLLGLLSLMNMDFVFVNNGKTSSVYSWLCYWLLFVFLAEKFVYWHRIRAIIMTTNDIIYLPSYYNGDAVNMHYFIGISIHIYRLIPLIFSPGSELWAKCYAQAAVSFFFYFLAEFSLVVCGHPSVLNKFNTESYV